MRGRPFVILNPGADNVAVALEPLVRGTRVPEFGVTLRRDIPRGHRFALRHIPKGKPLLQYGHCFARSRGIAAGDLVDESVIRDEEFDPARFSWRRPELWGGPEGFCARTWKGFARVDGRCGTRNCYLIVPASQCASDTALVIADRLRQEGLPESRYSHVDDIAVLPNTEGCGCASNQQLDRFMTVLSNFVQHPNVAGALVVDLGCEKTDCAALRPRMLTPGRRDLPIEFLSIQKCGGTVKTVKAAIKIAHRHLAMANKARRTSCSLADLVMGTECGASDAFSGITANPLIGRIADHVVYSGGSAILSEVPEMVGAESLLLRRMKTAGVAGKFLHIMQWYRNLADTMGVPLSDNLVAENRAGGLINPAIKSLGAIVKGGTAPIADVLEYGERIQRRGLQIMQGPGNDPESVTGLVSSGSTMICFSTGKGAVSGSPIVPVIKVSSTSTLFRRMLDDMDFDAGRLLGKPACSLKELADELLDQVTSVASGAKTATERNGQKQFQVWTAGKVSL